LIIKNETVLVVILCFVFIECGSKASAREYDRVENGHKLIITIPHSTVVDSSISVHESLDAVFLRQFFFRIFIHEIKQTRQRRRQTQLCKQMVASRAAGEFINEKDGGDRYEDSSSVFAKANDDIASERFSRCIH
jgi:hypothetical protein